MDQDQKKLVAAKASLEYIENGIVLGVGTGSTVNYLIDILPSVRVKIQDAPGAAESTSARRC